MIQVALSLLATALETGAEHLDKYDSLLDLVKDDLTRNLVLLLGKYSRNPIKRAARLTIFEIFSFGSLLIEPARLIILTKSSNLIANQLSKYIYIYFFFVKID